MKGVIATERSVSIAIFGSGYVGLVTGTCFAAAGVEVIGVDVDPTKLSRLQQGECPIYEPGLQALMQEAIAAGRLRFTGDAAAAISAAEILFIAVGTPPSRTATPTSSTCWPWPARSAAIWLPCASW